MIKRGVCYQKLPDKRGYFGKYGGRFVPETLMPACLSSKRPMPHRRRTRVPGRAQPAQEDLHGRPRRFISAKRLTAELAGQRSTSSARTSPYGAHKINNAIGQASSQRRWERKRLIAEPARDSTRSDRIGRGVCGLECEIYMGSDDVARQSLNVFRMKLLGAKVNEVTIGSRTLKTPSTKG